LLRFAILARLQAAIYILVDGARWEMLSAFSGFQLALQPLGDLSV
jgi:hypothetical protein